MKSVLVLAAVLFASVSCTKKSESPIEVIACSFEGAISMMGAGVITSKLQCAHPEAVQASMKKWFNQVGICDKKAKRDSAKASGGDMKVMGTVGDVVCAPALSLLPLFAMAQIPAEWGCTGPANMEQIKADLLKGCLELL